MPPAEAGTELAGGWPLVWAMSAAQVVSWGSLYYSFSLIVVPMEQTLGWSRAEINGALTFGLLVAAFLAYPVGATIDRRGGRLVMSAGSLLGALMLLAWSRVDGIVAFYAVWAGIGVAIAGTFYEPAFATLTRGFPDTFRRRITAMTFIGGFASTVFVPLTQIFIGAFEWRNALIALALCNLLIALPVHALWLRDGATGEAHVRPRAADDKERSALKAALRHPVFWLLTLCFTANLGVGSALLVHLLPMQIERGVPAAAVIAAYATFGPAQVFARLVFAFWFKSPDVRSFGPFVVAVLPLSIAPLMMFPGSLPVLFACTILFGIANGLSTLMRGMAVPDLLWREGYGAINGAMTMPINISRALAPFAAAMIWTATGNYKAVLWVMLATTILGAAAFFLALVFARRS